MAGSVSGVTPVRAYGWSPNSVCRNSLLATNCGEAIWACSCWAVLALIRSTSACGNVGLRTTSASTVSIRGSVSARPRI